MCALQQTTNVAPTRVAESWSQRQPGFLKSAVSQLYTTSTSHFGSTMVGFRLTRFSSCSNLYSQADYLANIYATEKDKVNCTFL